MSTVSPFLLVGKSGQPSFWRVFKYPELEVSQAIVSRSSFQADKAAFHWNRRGTNVFAMTQTEVSKHTKTYNSSLTPPQQ